MLKRLFMFCLSIVCVLTPLLAQSDWLEWNEDIAAPEELAGWQEKYEKIKARMVVHRALDKGDRDMAKWYLERKAKNEFSTKQEFDGTVNNKVVIVDDVPDEE